MKINKIGDGKMTKSEMKIIEAIAEKELGIETLETQFSDSLDFHDCCVAAIKDALIAAYEAGQKAAK